MTSDLSSKPPPNPVVTAYENFVNSTPLLTRSLMHLQVSTYLLSYFLPLDFALNNYPNFTLFRLEIYRILTSPLVNTSLFDVVLAYFALVPISKRLEWSMGSTKFGFLCWVLALASNLGFLVLCYLLYFVSSSELWLIRSTGSIWIVAFGLFAVEALQAEAQSETQRRVCFLTVPTRYSPLAFYLLISILSADLNIGFFISMALGYAIGLGLPHTDQLQLNVTRAQQLEETHLAQFVSRAGWVSSQAATGMAAWNVDQPGNSAESSSMLPMFRIPTGSAAIDPPSSSSEATMPVGSGRTLGGGGGATRRAVDPRAARLQALAGKNDSEEKM